MVEHIFVSFADCSSFVDSCNCTIKANWDTSEVVTHARQKLCRLHGKQSYFVKMFIIRPAHPGLGCSTANSLSR